MYIYIHTYTYTNSTHAYMDAEVKFNCILIVIITMIKIYNI